MNLGGVDLGDYMTSAEKSSVLIGVRERGARGRLHVHTTAEVEDEAIELMPLSPSIASALALHLRGSGETFIYRADTSTTGSKGTVPNAGGTYTFTATNGPHTNARCEVGSNSFIEYPTRTIGQGSWTLRVQKYETIADDGAAADAWYRYVIRGSATSVVSWYRNGVSGGLVDPSNWIIMASDGDFRLLGKDADGTNNAKYYSEAQIHPFSVQTAWMSATDTDMNGAAPPGLPFHNMVDSAAEFEPLASTTPIVVSARASGANRMRYGAPHMRVLRVLVQHRSAVET